MVMEKVHLLKYYEFIKKKLLKIIRKILRLLYTFYTKKNFFKETFIHLALNFYVRNFSASNVIIFLHRESWNYFTDFKMVYKIVRNEFVRKKFLALVCLLNKRFFFSVASLNYCFDLSCDSFLLLFVYLEYVFVPSCGNLPSLPWSAASKFGRS